MPMDRGSEAAKRRSVAFPAGAPRPCRTHFAVLGTQEVAGSIPAHPPVAPCACSGGAVVTARQQPTPTLLLGSRRPGGANPRTAAEPSRLTRNPGGPGVGLHAAIKRPAIRCADPRHRHALRVSRQPRILLGDAVETMCRPDGAGPRPGDALCPSAADPTGHTDPMAATVGGLVDERVVRAPQQQHRGWDPVEQLQRGLLLDEHRGQSGCEGRHRAGRSPRVDAGQLVGAASPVHPPTAPVGRDELPACRGRARACPCR